MGKIKIHWGYKEGYPVKINNFNLSERCIGRGGLKNDFGGTYQYLVKLTVSFNI